jgi:AcrR family transcriptional regulator
MVRVRFGSKLGLLRAVLEREFEAPLIAPARDLSLRCIDRVLGIVDAMTTMVAEEPAFFRAVSTLRDLGPHTEAWLSELEEAVTDALQAGQQDGSVRLDLDCEAEGKHWVATGVGLVFRWCQDDAFDYDEALLDWRRRLERHCAAPAEDARDGDGVVALAGGGRRPT